MEYILVIAILAILGAIFFFAISWLDDRFSKMPP